MGLVLLNHGDDEFRVQQADRIAQLILQKIDPPIVEEIQDLNSTSVEHLVSTVQRFNMMLQGVARIILGQ